MKLLIQIFQISIIRFNCENTNGVEKIYQEYLHPLLNKDCLGLFLKKTM